MSSLRTALAVNGVVFLVRAAMNLLRPTSFYADEAATGPHQDAVRVIGISYATLGLIQLGATRSELQAVRSAAAASGLFAAGVAVQAATLGPGPDSYHRLRYGAAVENAAVALLYGTLLIRDRRRTG